MVHEINLVSTTVTVMDTFSTAVKAFETSWYFPLATDALPTVSRTFDFGFRLQSQKRAAHACLAHTAG